MANGKFLTEISSLETWRLLGDQFVLKRSHGAGGALIIFFVFVFVFVCLSLIGEISSLKSIKQLFIDNDIPEQKSKAEGQIYGHVCARNSNVFFHVIKNLQIIPTQTRRNIKKKEDGGSNVR